MTSYIWARIFIASLIFFGDWVFAAESRPRVEIDAAASDIATQISKQTIPDDAESSIEPVIMGVAPTPPVTFTINRKLASTAYTAPDKLRYLPLHPRAPPLTVTS
ncbi:MAG: hypothetical protein PVG12_05740 [Gammaproteobacteria bacterium]|jgi:hypothetical protein